MIHLSSFKAKIHMQDLLELPFLPLEHLKISNHTLTTNLPLLSLHPSVLGYIYRKRISFVWIGDNLNMAITRLFVVIMQACFKNVHPLKHPKHLGHLFQFLKFISTPICTIQVSLVRLGLVITCTLI